MEGSLKQKRRRTTSDQVLRDETARRTYCRTFLVVLDAQLRSVGASLQKFMIPATAWPPPSPECLIRGQGVAVVRRGDDFQCIFSTDASVLALRQ
eukprot:6492549-Amphidinium_carterae.1